jgi:hypothetical protein
MLTKDGEQAMCLNCLYYKKFAIHGYSQVPGQEGAQTLIPVGHCINAFSDHYLHLTIPQHYSCKRWWHEDDREGQRKTKK